MRESKINERTNKEIKNSDLRYGVKNGIVNRRRDYINSTCNYNSNPNNTSSSSNKSSIWRRRVNKKSRASRRILCK